MTKPPGDAAFFVLLRRAVLVLLVDAGTEAGSWGGCCCSVGTRISRPAVYLMVVVELMRYDKGQEDNSGRSTHSIRVEHDRSFESLQTHRLCGIYRWQIHDESQPLSLLGLVLCMPRTKVDQP